MRRFVLDGKGRSGPSGSIIIKINNDAAAEDKRQEQWTLCKRLWLEDGWMDNEYLDIVTEENVIVTRALRSECHGNPGLIHRAAHILVFNSRGQLLLQKRSMSKDIQPGKWDTSVGGHVASGETYEEAAFRELEEELGIRGVSLDYLYNYRMRNEMESENIRSYRCMIDVGIEFNREEIDAVRFWDMEEIAAAMGTGIFTPNFEQEIGLYGRRSHPTRR